MKILKRKKVDKAHYKTDLELADIERQIERLYEKSYPRIQSEWMRYLTAHEKELEKPLIDLNKALMGGTAAEIALAKANYQRKAQKILINSRDFKRMSEDVASKITKTNVRAVNRANVKLPLVYTINYNQLDDTIKKANLKVDYSFNLVNEDAVRELAERDRAFLPRRKVDVPKDIAWNQKQINSQVMQGIQQGESIPKIAKRLQNVTDMSKTAAIRNARTMVTAAENKGRLDSFEKAESDGLKLKKTWSCVHDNRTRNWHRALDGVSLPLDEAWENEYGELMYPGDPMGHPANVYNCRCSMVGDIEGFSW